MTTKGKKIDYLDEDKEISGQKWVCLSFLSPEGIRNCKIRGIKVRGVFSDRKDADDHAKELQQIDPDFHVFVGEMGKWLPQDPDPESVEDQVYREEKLNDLMKGYKENLLKAKTMEKERQRTMKEEALKDAVSKKNKRVARLKKKLEKKKLEKLEGGVTDGQLEESKKSQINNAIELISNETLAKTSTVLTEKSVQSTPVTADAHAHVPETKGHDLSAEIKNTEQVVIKEKEKIDTVEKKIEESTKNLSTVEDNLVKMKELYSKLVQKRASK
ncbi:MAG: hypothetical protein Edafosvirus8_4 [Edafosvirus sp.]|uniref:Uncharacterized protein n=1 Tax=Edafosvirus sp. TaxID=2487765 RepID=A0A3G4ZV98_9VIRU|nr:MAG: hypothetical protein Edafosvirus8_4 [Edafosvirus sp.]